MNAYKLGAYFLWTTWILLYDIAYLAYYVRRHFAGFFRPGLMKHRRQWSYSQ